MESKDLHFDEFGNTRMRAKCSPLQLESTKVEEPEPPALPSSSASSHTASTKSPTTPGDDSLSSATEAAPDSPDAEFTKEPSSGPQRARASTSPTVKAGEGREKRKRSRVTPEQLAHLERFFAADRSPTAIRRREISEILGMQERQTQIWFQNRRAKAKLLDGKKGRSSAGDWSETPPDTPPQLSPGFEADLHSLIHEDEPVTIIPCSDLSIGTWRRIATTLNKHDLVAYVCDAKRCLTWFIHSAGYGFKMEIPYETIIHTEFRNASPGQGLASFTLSQPPIFYLEHLTSPREGLGVARSWKKCADWTEGMQATKVLRHDLIGSAVHLAHFLQDLRDNRSSSDIQLLTPPLYNVDEASPSLQLPPPPFASLRNEPFSAPLPPHHQLRPDYMGHGRKRSFSGPPAYSTPPTSFGSHEFSLHGAPPPPESPASASYTTSTFSQASERFGSMPYSHNYAPRMASDFSSTDMQPSHRQQPSSSSDYSQVPISHAAASRSYTTNPSSQYMYDQGRGSPSYFEGMHRASTSPSTHSHYQSPSPPLLTPSFNTQPGNIMLDPAGYRPMPSMHHLLSHHPLDNSTAISGMPAAAYSSAERRHGQDVSSDRDNSLAGALSSTTTSPTGEMQMPPSAD